MRHREDSSVGRAGAAGGELGRARLRSLGGRSGLVVFGVFLDFSVFLLFFCVFGEFLVVFCLFGVFCVVGEFWVVFCGFGVFCVFVDFFVVFVFLVVFCVFGEFYQILLHRPVHRPLIDHSSTIHRPLIDQFIDQFL